MTKELSNPRKARHAIFLPVRNGQPFIAQAIESVLNQTQKDFLLAVLDNRSIDGTLETVRKYSDPRIIIMEAERSLDISQNWHRVQLILESVMIQAEFVTILGHDDLLYPDFLDRIDGLISKCPEATLFQTHFDLIDQNGNILRPCKPVPDRESHKDFFLARCWGNRDSFGTGYVFRPQDFIRIGGYADFPQLLWADDLLVLKLAGLSCKVCDGHSSFAYRVHGKSASGVMTVGKFIAFAEASRRYLTEVEEHHRDLIEDDYGKISLGFAMARQMELLDLPFQSWFLGENASRTIGQIKEKAKKLMQGNTVDRLSDRSFLYRWIARIKKYFIAPRLSR